MTAAATAATGAPAPVLHDARAQRRVFKILGLSVFSSAVIQSEVIAAIPQIERDLGVSAVAAGWVLTAHLLTAAVATPLIGRLGDSLRPSRVFVWVLWTLVAGTVLAALAMSLPLLIAARVLQGVSLSVVPLAYAIIRTTFPREVVGSKIAQIAALLGTGAGIGVVASGLVVEHLSYHWLFWIPLLPLTLTALVARKTLPVLPVPKAPLPRPAAAVWMGLGLGGLLLALTQVRAWGLGDGRTLGLIAASLVFIGIWIRTELRSIDPVINVRLMRTRGVLAANLVAILVGVAQYTGLVLIPRFVQEPGRLAVSPTLGGVFLLPLTLAIVVSGLLVSRLQPRFGAKPLLLAGLAMGVVALVQLAFLPSGVVNLCIATGALGLGIGLPFATLGTLVLVFVRGDQAGMAGGMNTVMRTIGAAAGAQVMATLVADDNYALGFAVAGVALALALPVAAAIPGRGHRLRTFPPPPPAL